MALTYALHQLPHYLGTKNPLQLLGLYYILIFQNPYCFGK